MSEMHAVVGYLPDATAKAASQGHHKAPLEVRLEQGKDEMHVRIDPGDIIGVLLGASNKGETGVQVFVKPSAKIDTVTRGAVADFVLQPIRDLSLLRLRPPINVIYFDPRLVQKLVALQTQER
jgi:hypothetical protein